MDVWSYLFICYFTIASTYGYHTIQRLMSSKGAKWTIFYNITVSLQYCWDKTIARSGDMYRDASCIFSLAIKRFGNTNTSVQNFAIRISSVKTVPTCLLKLKVFEQIKYRCIIFTDVFTPCDSDLSKILRKSCDIVLNPSFCSLT